MNERNLLQLDGAFDYRSQLRIVDKGCSQKVVDNRQSNTQTVNQWSNIYL